MKKALSMLLAIIMVLTLMVGCGDKNNNCLLYTSDAADEL